ncbi:MAG: type secretion system permease/ATPase [Caulobacteraceae bacterium]|nr:type secretion system permease/ATPase [Caulobacteraceae bacterium]
MSLSNTTARSELRQALDRCRQAFVSIAVMSGVLNILVLSGSFFMMLVYDRVVPSRSGITLVGLIVMVIVAYVFQAALDSIRSRMLIQIGASLDTTLNGRIFEVVSQYARKAKATGDGLLPVRDLDQIRAFLSSSGPLAFIDLPWMLFYLALLYMFHPFIGMVATGGALVLCVLTLMTERLTKEPTRLATQISSQRNAMAEACRRNAEVLYALGMERRQQRNWMWISDQYLAAQQRLSNVAGGMSGLTRTIRMLLQSLVLATGAYLVISDKATGGVIFASSIISSRALAPVELAIGNWKGFAAARQSWTRLTDLLRAFPAEVSGTKLPPPASQLQVEAVSIAPPGAQRLTVQDVSFQLTAGDGLGIIGPSASGKSTLARALVGVWKPVRGVVRLDGAAIDQWTSEDLGPHLGYLPQDVELFEGTVAQNIARFDNLATSDQVIAAARAAEVHDLIVHLPDGYDTEVGPNGVSLSAGQRQRVALARALFRDPFLVVLDEPNSNLDSEGEAALTRAISTIRARGGIAIIVAHRPSVLSSVNQVLYMADGRMRGFGPKNEVLPKILAQPALPGAPPMAVNSGQ